MRKILINLIVIIILGFITIGHSKAEKFVPNMYFTDPPKFSYNEEFICFDIINGTVFVGRSEKGWVRRVDTIENICEYFVYKNQHKIYKKLKNYLVNTQGRNKFDYGQKYPIADQVFESFLGKKPEKKYSKILHEKIKLQKIDFNKKKSEEEKELLAEFNQELDKITKEEKIEKTEPAQTQKKAFTNKLVKIDEFKYDESRKFDPLYNIELLGRYNNSFESSKDFPKEMIEFWGGNEKCLKFYCRQQKSSKEMSKRFKRNKKYNNKYPGSIFYAMAHFEYYYQFKLYKGEKSISKTLAKFEGKKSLNSGYTDVKSLIGLNKIRKKLRNALGMDLKTDPVVAINKFWTMGNFMSQAEVKQNELNEEIIIRKKLIDKYKSLSEKLRKKAEKNLEKEMFKKIKKGKV